MLKRRLQVGLPRRISAYFLLFGMAAVLWLGIGAIYVARLVHDSESERASLLWLGRASSRLELHVARNQPEGVQAVVDEAKLQAGVAYCAIVSPDGEYMAHSVREQVGRRAPNRSGFKERWGDVVRVRYTDDAGRTFSEFQAPLTVGEKRIGEVRLGVIEPSLRSLAVAAGQFAPLMFIVPACCLAGGAVLLNRLVRPFAEIEQQLSTVATSPAVEGVEFEEVTALGLAAVGWNQVVNQRLKQQPDGGLQNRLQQSLQAKRENRLDAMLASIPEGIATTDRQGRITYANPAMSAILGLGDEAGNGVLVNGASDGPLLIEELSKTWVIPQDSVIAEATNAERQASTEVAEREDGSGRVVRVVCQPLLAANSSSHESHVWLIRDITQQKLAERMRNQFVDTATHELRTPLANIKAYAETLALTDVIDVEQQKQFLNTINAEAARLARFVDDLLNVSSMEVGSLTLNKQVTDIGRMLNDVLAKVRPQMDEKRLTFDISFPEKFPEPVLDKDKVGAVLVNLLGNAAKYTPSGGRVSLRVHVTDEQLEIIVEDTGFGIAEQDLSRVFDKFFRSNDARVQEQTGTGLGLSLAREVVRLHGGDITVESEVDKGSTFKMILPIS